MKNIPIIREFVAKNKNPRKPVKSVKPVAHFEFRILTSSISSNIYTLVGYTLALNICGGFIYNNIYSYCLSRFSKNAGVASGLTGGGTYMLSSLFSYGFVNLYAVKSQLLLGFANISLIAIVVIVFLIFNRYRAQNLATIAVKS